MDQLLANFWPSNNRRPLLAVDSLSSFSIKTKRNNLIERQNLDAKMNSCASYKQKVLNSTKEMESSKHIRTNWLIKSTLSMAGYLFILRLLILCLLIMVPIGKLDSYQFDTNPQVEFPNQNLYQNHRNSIMKNQVSSDENRLMTQNFMPHLIQHRMQQISHRMQPPTIAPYNWLKRSFPPTVTDTIPTDINESLNRGLNQPNQQSHTLQFPNDSFTKQLSTDELVNNPRVSFGLSPPLHVNQLNATSRYLVPAVEKLYNFLFPFGYYPSGVLSKFPSISSGQNQNSIPIEAFQVSSSNNQNEIIPNLSLKSMRKPILSLNAPYESPLKSIGLELKNARSAKISSLLPQENHEVPPSIQTNENNGNIVRPSKTSSSNQYDFQELQMESSNSSTSDIGSSGSSRHQLSQIGSKELESEPEVRYIPSNENLEDTDTYQSYSDGPSDHQSLANQTINEASYDDRYIENYEPVDVNNTEQMVNVEGEAEIDQQNQSKYQVNNQEHQQNNLNGGREEPNSSYPTADEMANSDEISANDSKESSMEEAPVTVQLPSQYDSAIQIPPEGYYDDYFKLATDPNPVSEANKPENLTRGYMEQSRYEKHNQPEIFAEHYKDTVNLQPSAYTTTNDQMQDYTNQYYLNQQPLRQIGDQNVEFIAVNRTNGDNQQKSIKYVYDNSTSNVYTNSSTGYQNWPSSTNNSISHKNLHSNQTQVKPKFNNPNEDSINVIIANTNNSNSIDREKMINYVSENRNITLAGKSHSSPRETFVNRDMNEFPLVEQYNINTTDTSPDLPPNQNRTELVNQQYSKQPPDDSGQEPDNESLPLPMTSHDDEDELLKASVNSDYGRYNTRHQRAPDRDARARHFNKTSKLEQIQSIDPKGQRDRYEPARAASSLEDPSRKSAPNHRQTPTLRRPQLNDGQLNQKELVLRPPTPKPTISESTIGVITEIPGKIKQLHENQADKNELMNELLTALDRVKAAIYKLQPLTARMNAMYRKSVTSNTRDIVMDNHKGTYAKRYPPGDYDDSYGRLHPSEVLVGHGHKRRNRRSGALEEEKLDSTESASSASYLPAPRDLLEGMLKNRSISSLSDSEFPADDGDESLSLGESRLVATGIGRRLGDGSVAGKLRLSTIDGRVTYENDMEGSDSLELSSGKENSSLGMVDSPQSPLFGYKITIYQAPEDEANQSSDNDDALEPINESNGDQSTGTLDRADVDNDDIMVTSESSLVGVSYANSTGDVLDLSESKKQKETEEWKKEHKQGKESKEKHSKEKGDKSGEKSKKSSAKKKKDHVESHKKKEYKKIKNHKGILSKEKKTMHRDKQIKAHDRGAAKEKALKERTQIEFFEREQIVDDEFEKAKKSTVKAGWQSGHESKKSTKDTIGGDAMSLGGSHFVKHEPKDFFAEKGQAMGVESASGKESNKFEKKNMEAKGKKFKGWREKGYKIITETEFIDRGSLHDSAYKKRDKGAAHHQKYKKQDSSSEGQQGSMHEQHKKSHKKEEKKSKMNEKKNENSKKGREEKKKKKKKDQNEVKKKKKITKSENDHELEEAAATVGPIQTELVGSGLHLWKNNHTNSNGNHPSLNLATLSAFKALEKPQNKQSDAFIRLLTANHDDDHQADELFPSIVNLTLLHNPKKELEPARYQTISEDYVVERRSDNSSSLDFDGDFKHPFKVHNVTYKPDRNNASSMTILDIVDNLTGRHVDKTKIGTYSLDDASKVDRNSSLRSVFTPVKLNNDSLSSLKLTNSSDMLNLLKSTMLNSKTLEPSPRGPSPPHLPSPVQQINTTPPKVHAPVETNRLSSMNQLFQRNQNKLGLAQISPVQNKQASRFDTNIQNEDSTLKLLRMIQSLRNADELIENRPQMNMLNLPTQIESHPATINQPSPLIQAPFPPRPPPIYPNAVQQMNLVNSSPNINSNAFLEFEQDVMLTPNLAHGLVV